MGSDRAFGLVFAAFFGIVYAWRAMHGLPGQWALLCTAAFLVIAAVAPRTLRPLNVLWFRFGLVLHRIASPIILGVIFFGVIAPIGLLMRFVGRRPLYLDKDEAAATYWINREPPGPPGESFRNQF